MSDKQLTDAIRKYIMDNSLYSLDIIMKQAWDNGILTNVTIKIEKHGSHKFGNEY